MYIPVVHANLFLTMNVWYKYSYNKNCTIPYFINLISNKANFAIEKNYFIVL